MARLSDPQKEGMETTLIGHVSGDVPLEKWLNVEADKVGTIAKKLLDKFTGAIVEELANTQETLMTVQEELEFVRGKASNMS